MICCVFVRKYHSSAPPICIALQAAMRIARPAADAVMHGNADTCHFDYFHRRLPCLRFL